jgi:hypothetical protein
MFKKALAEGNFFHSVSTTLTMTKKKFYDIDIFKGLLIKGSAYFVGGIKLGMKA